MAFIIINPTINNAEQKIFVSSKLYYTIELITKVIFCYLKTVCGCMKNKRGIWERGHHGKSGSCGR